MIFKNLPIVAYCIVFQNALECSRISHESCRLLMNPEYGFLFPFLAFYGPLLLDFCLEKTILLTDKSKEPGSNRARGKNVFTKTRLID